jgi:hypothetical protein
MRPPIDTDREPLPCAPPAELPVQVAKARIAQQTAEHHRVLLQLHVHGEL